MKQYFKIHIVDNPYKACGISEMILQSKLSPQIRQTNILIRIPYILVTGSYVLENNLLPQTLSIYDRTRKLYIHFKLSSEIVLV